MRLSVLLSMMLIFMTGVSFGQRLSREVIGAYGNYYNNNFFNISATTGETMVSTFQAEEGNFLTQGFQQPSLSSIHNERLLDSINIYPNPVVPDVELTITFCIKEVNSYTVEIYNITGAKVYVSRYNDVIFNQHVNIDFSSFTEGIYLVHVYSGDGKWNQTLKIIKL
jgi:hypothetical protein